MPAVAASPEKTELNGQVPAQVGDPDFLETQEWLDSLDAVVESSGPDRARFLLTQLQIAAQRLGAAAPTGFNTPYVNTIPVHEQPTFPGNREMERRVKSINRWNAMVMVARGHNGGHISTYASAATLLEVGLNHFFRGPDAEGGGDQVIFQGHASPGLYARAYLEGRISEEQLLNFRKEVGGKGLSSYPHPWLMPNFWQFPSVSMGLGPLFAIYQARFNRYLHHRGLKDTSKQHVWCFIGDGETDEPESLGALTLASREKLDNLTFIINCNLQRLDGPVRGNGKIIQELEAAFRGAGWNVLKVIWGSNWDPLFERDVNGLLQKRFESCLDGEFQKYVVEGGAYIREHFFGVDPQLLELVKDMSDEEITNLKRGGHDPVKVYAAYKSALEHKGRPTVILAKTIKGYGLGEAGEARNTTHQQKSMTEAALKYFRVRFDIPVKDEKIEEMPHFHPGADSPEAKYVRERGKALGGSLPARVVRCPKLEVPSLDAFKGALAGSGTHKASTTAAFVDILNNVLLRDKNIGKQIVPIIPDEARTFGMDSMFVPYGIYSSVGQLYEPVDSKFVKNYREAKDGVILEEGITEAGSMATFTAASTAYATHGLPMIPFYIYYSMFGFQRIGDQAWAAGDMRARGFLLGATAGRTTLNGEGLQHQDGQSHLQASIIPNLVAYDPAYAYEVAVIIQDGIKRMYADGQDLIYYLTLQNEAYEMPAMPEGAASGIIKGMYKLKPAPVKDGKRSKVHLLGSAIILRECLRAQDVLANKFGVAADVWSVTSYGELRRDALACERWNRLHPTAAARKSYIEATLEKEPGVYISASDYMKATSEMIARWVPGGLLPLGTDGYGRSDDRSKLRRHFEVDAENIVVASLTQLMHKKEIAPDVVAKAIKDLGLDAEKPDPVTA